MRALVTGCAGFIGSHLTQALLEQGDDVVGVDCFNDNYGRWEKLENLDQSRQWNNFDFVPIDLARGDLQELVAECDVVFHLAGEPGVRASWGRRFEHYLRNNILATQHLLEAARAAPPDRFVYASSSSIYGQAEALPTPESATPQPFSPYGTTKLAGEHLCRLYHGNYGLPVVSLRYFSVYGPRQRPDMAFSTFCEAALRGEPLTVYGSGRQTRDFTYVEDVVAATRSAAESQSAIGRVYNIGGGSRVSLGEALEILAELTERPLDVQYQSFQYGDVLDTGAETAAARRDLDFRPSMAFPEGLGLQFAWVSNRAPKRFGPSA